MLKEDEVNVRTSELPQYNKNNRMQLQDWNQIISYFFKAEETAPGRKGGTMKKKKKKGSVNFGSGGVQTLFYTE